MTAFLLKTLRETTQKRGLRLLLFGKTVETYWTVFWGWICDFYDFSNWSIFFLAFSWYADMHIYFKREFWSLRKRNVLWLYLPWMLIFAKYYYDWCHPNFKMSFHLNSRIASSRSWDIILLRNTNVFCRLGLPFFLWLFSFHNFGSPSVWWRKRRATSIYSLSEWKEELPGNFFVGKIVQTSLGDSIIVWRNFEMREWYTIF